MSWKGEHVINIVCQPSEIELEQLGLFLLATPNTIMFSWHEGYFILFRYRQEMYQDTDKKIAGFITVVWGIEYIKTTYRKFVRMNGNTGETIFTDTMENSDSDYFFYPVSNAPDEIVIEVSKKIKECDHAIKRK